MTVSEFLDRLYETPRTWRLVNTPLRRGFIRRDGMCPAAEVIRALSPDWPKYIAAPCTHGFTWAAVMKAADNVPGHDPTIRRALLHACGLTQEMP